METIKKYRFLAILIFINSSNFLFSQVYKNFNHLTLEYYDKIDSTSKKINEFTIISENADTFITKFYFQNDNKNILSKINHYYKLNDTIKFCKEIINNEVIISFYCKNEYVKFTFSENYNQFYEFEYIDKYRIANFNYSESLIFPNNIEIISELDFKNKLVSSYIYEIQDCNFKMYDYFYKIKNSNFFSCKPLVNHIDFSSYFENNDIKTCYYIKESKKYVNQKKAKINPKYTVSKSYYFNKMTQYSIHLKQILSF